MRPLVVGSTERAIQPFVNWLNQNIETTIWSQERFLEDFSRRSPHRIRQDGDIPFLGSCLDVSLLMIEYLQGVGYETSLIIEHLYDHNNDREGIHYAIRKKNPLLDGNLEPGGAIIDNQDRTNIIVTPPPYRNLQDVTSYYTVELQGPIIPDRNLFENYPDHPFVQELYKHLPEFTGRLQEHNTPERFNKYQDEIAHQKDYTVNSTGPYATPPKHI